MESSIASARVSARAVVGRVRSASPNMSPILFSRAGIVLTVYASMCSRAVSSRGWSGAETVAPGFARTLYALAALLPRAFCNAST